MILDVDIGNTRVKWRFSGCDVVTFQLTSELAAEGIPSSLKSAKLESQKIRRVRVASVGQRAALEALERGAQQLWGVSIEVAKVGQNTAGVKPAYEDLTRLGVDRWLMLLAAFKRYPNGCVIVSAGSALTADWIDATGRHLGGYIVPGRRKMADVLKWGVADVLREQRDMQSLMFESGVLEPGGSTERCVEAGINAACRGFLLEVLGRRPDLPVLVAGGDAEAVIALCGEQHKKRMHCCEFLVLDGLAIALP